MSAEIKVEEPGIVLVSPEVDLGACPPDYPDGPCAPVNCSPRCNPNCVPACVPSSLPCKPQIPCYPDVGRPPTPPYPGPD